jgi:hypothetical protein
MMHAQQCFSKIIFSAVCDDAACLSDEGLMMARTCAE